MGGTDSIICPYCATRFRDNADLGCGAIPADSVVDERAYSVFTQDGREPPLLVAWESGRAVVMPYLQEPGGSDEIAPGGKIEEAAVAVAADAFFVVSPRV